jgi:hypothetical protein
MGRFCWMMGKPHRVHALLGFLVREMAAPKEEAADGGRQRQLEPSSVLVGVFSLLARATCSVILLMLNASWPL